MTEADDDLEVDDPYRVRASRRARRSRRRRPTNAGALVVRVDDHRNGTVYASFVAQDGKRWRAYAHWPKPERVPLDRLEWDADGSVWELDLPDHVDPAGVEEVPALHRRGDHHPVDHGGEHCTLTVEAQRWPSDPECPLSA